MPRASLFRSHLPAALVLGAVAIAAATPAAAQSSVCAEGQGLIQKHAEFNAQFGKMAGGDKKIDPIEACPLLTKMSANAQTTVKWLESNKDWCQVPEAFAANFTASAQKIQSIRTQACKVAAQVEAAKKQAQQRAQQGGPAAAFSGGGLTGDYKLPKGAL